MMKEAVVGLLGLGNKKLAHPLGKVDLVLRSNYDDEFYLHVQAFVLPQVTGLQPSAPFENDWLHLKGLKLADPSFNIPQGVDMILGVDTKAEIMLGGFIKGPLGMPVAELTVFGWIVWGPVGTEHTDIMEDYDQT